MATDWVLGKISDALAPTVHGAVSTAGSFAGGAINAVGNSINGVGEGINNSIRRYGDGAKDYGNSVMDWTKAEGFRGQTAANPLGLSGGSTTGRHNVTSPSIYSAPAKAPVKTITAAKKPAGTQIKAIEAPKAKATPKATATPKSTPATVKPVVPGNKKTAVAVPKPSTSTKAPVPVKKTATPAKAKTSTVSATKANSTIPTQASNPLGLSWA